MTGASGMYCVLGARDERRRSRRGLIGESRCKPRWRDPFCYRICRWQLSENKAQMPAPVSAILYVNGVVAGRRVPKNLQRTKSLWMVQYTDRYIDLVGVFLTLYTVWL